MKVENISLLELGFEKLASADSTNTPGVAYFQTLLERYRNDKKNSTKTQKADITM